MTSIGFLAQFAYDTGQAPLDYAEVNVIRAHVDSFLNPGAYPGEVNPATVTLSRQILGDLLDAGWTAPDPAGWQVPGGLEIPETPEDLEDVA